MKSKLYLLALYASVMCTSSVYGGIPGKCPEVDKEWDGKTAIEEWEVDHNYTSKVEEKIAEDKKSGYKPYTFLNAWLYFPEKSNNKAAVCHYNIEGKGHNKLSLIIAGKNTDNTHFAPNAFVHEGRNGQGMHCSLKGGAPKIDDCVYEDGPTLRKKTPAK